MIQWVFVVPAMLVAVAALIRARRTAKRLERLQESYWDLRYELGQLQARMNRLETGAPAPSAAPPQGAAAFVPLSSLKR